MAGLRVGSKVIVKNGSYPGIITSKIGTKKWMVKYYDNLVGIKEETFKYTEIKNKKESDPDFEEVSLASAPLSTSLPSSSTTEVEAVLTSKSPPVFAYVTQGRTDHMVTIIDQHVLKLLGTHPGWSLNELDSNSEIQIRWNNNGEKQKVIVSNVRLIDLEDEDRSNYDGGGNKRLLRPQRKASAKSPSKLKDIVRDDDDYFLCLLLLLLFCTIQTMG